MKPNTNIKVDIDPKLKLRTNGLYVQFGYRPWLSGLGETGDCWYNIIKVIDDNNFFLLGSFNMAPFFEINQLSQEPGKKFYAFESYNGSGILAGYNRQAVKLPSKNLKDWLKKTNKRYEKEHLLPQFFCKFRKPNQDDKLPDYSIDGKINIQIFQL